MTAPDPRLDVALQVLTVALGGYLRRLRSMWSAAHADDEVTRLLAGIGVADAVPSSEREVVQRAVAAMGAAEHGALARIAGRLDLDIADQLSVAAAWWVDADPQVAVALGCAHDDATRRYASAGVLRLLLAPHGIAAPPAREEDDPLVRWGLLQPGAGSKGPLTLTPSARHLLAGTPVTALSTDAGCVVPARHDRQRARLAAYLRQDHPECALVRGPAGTGRRALARAAAADAGRLVVEEGRRGDAELRLLARLGDAVPLVPLRRLAEASAAGAPWSADDGPLLCWGEPGEAAQTERQLALVVDVTAPSPAERRRLWSAAGVDGDTSAALAARFVLGDDDVAHLVEQARTEAALSGRRMRAEHLWAAARRRSPGAVSRLAAVVRPAVTLDDLVVTPDLRAQLAELVAQVALQHVVLDGWGFRDRLPRGQGVAALFSGPPGTGKTLAAEAVAGELGQDLYRIDLSAVVSKYIGETEKHLAQAFDEAERAAAVLFFDECDGLFGKRTEQHDAHDRWANLEVDYLLQRVETFTGLVVLATNRRSAIDEAFLRRLRFSLRFEMPDAALRSALWRRAFPDGVPLGELDWEALAAREVAGGTVVATALAAAFLAAADGGSVRAEHVEHALRREYQKLGKTWTGDGGRS